MRRHNILLTLGVVLFSMLTLNSQNQDFTSLDSQEIFVQANSLYKAGKFEQAIDLYKSIPDKSAYAYYNLGNSAYQLEKYGFAMLYWRKAEKLWGFFNRDELIDNITLLQEKIRILNSGIEKKRSPITLSFIKIKNVIMSWLRSFPLILLQFFFLLLWLFLFIYLRFLFKKRQKLVIATLFGFIAFFGIILAARHNIESRTYGVITNRSTPMRSGPGESFQTLINLNQAQEVVIQKESGNFYKVKIFWQTGWIDKDHAGII